MGGTFLRDRVAEQERSLSPGDCSPPREGMDRHCFEEAAEYLPASMSWHSAGKIRSMPRERFGWSKGGMLDPGRDLGSNNLAECLRGLPPLSVFGA